MGLIKIVKKRNAISGEAFPGCASLDFVDPEKLAGLKNEIISGIHNYLLFQKCSSIRWPLWVCGESASGEEEVYTAYPPLLLNRRHRNWVRFTNLFSESAVNIDRAGMISPTYDSWSIEIWAISGDLLVRPAERMGNVMQHRDLSTAVVHTVWKEKDFTVRTAVYGIKTSIDEAVLSVACTAGKKSAVSGIMVVVRPYDLERIGGAHAIEYKRDARILRINGYERLQFDSRPSFVAGRSAISGDFISGVIDDDESHSVSCRYGMATMAFVYPLNDGEVECAIRIGLSKTRGIAPAKVNLRKSKDEYGRFAALRMHQGMNLSFPDAAMQNWFYGAKLSLLNIARASSGEQAALTGHSARTAFFISAACARAGFLDESEKIVNTLLQKFGAVRAEPFEKNGIAACIVAACADLFIHSRDTEYLRRKYSALLNIASGLHAGSSALRSGDTVLDRNKNSLAYNLLGKTHLPDVLIMHHALAQFTYLSRCMGLFGDEAKFGAEAKRIGGILARVLLERYPDGEHGATRTACDEFDVYDILASYPFTVGAWNEAETRAFAMRIASCVKSVPVYMKPLGGWDCFLSIIVSINMLLAGDAGSVVGMRRLMETDSGCFALPDVVCPSTGKGVLGNGESPLAASAMFMWLRSMVLHDSERRLELFPAPVHEWFRPGSEIVIQNAPTRYGPVSVRVVSSSGEIQFRFPDLPKFVPPEIMLHLPCKAKIKKENDFLIKKEDGTTFIINGWPSLVRCMI